MCGILGSINLPFDNSALERMAHRGPDDSGIEEIQYKSHTVLFGHRRLSILDLSPTGPPTATIFIRLPLTDDIQIQYHF